MPVPHLAVSLDETSAEPMYRQLYEELRTRILGGRLRGGVKLPSTRDLATQLHVSRNTVTAAFDQLLSEGYLTGRTGSGTYVCSRLPDDLLRADSGSATPAEAVLVRLSARAQLMLELPQTASVAPVEWGPAAPRPFRLHTPAMDAFPFAQWHRIMSHRWRTAGHELFCYGDAAGYRPLREAVAAYVKAARAVRCEPEQVLIVSGTQQGLDLTAKTLLDPGDSILLEDPGYIGARSAFCIAGARVIPVPVNEHGLDIAAGARKAPGARLAFVSPSRQYPLGITMSLTRRLELIEWAKRNEAWIVEDDYDSEIRYSGRPLASLQGLDPHGRVVYVGTFSKVLMPSLRLAYVVVPPGLVDAFTQAKAHSDWSCPQFEQAVLADFLTEGHFARHIRRMRALYQERQEFLVEAARRRLGGLLDVRPENAGMHLVGWLPPGVDEGAAARAAVDAGVDAAPLSTYALEPYPHGALLLGYASFGERDIVAGVEKLATALEQLRGR